MKRVPTSTNEKAPLLLSPVSVGSTVGTRSSSRKKVRRTFVIDLTSSAPVINPTPAPEPVLLPKPIETSEDKVLRLEKRLRRYRQKLKTKDILELDLRENISKLNLSLDQKTKEYEREKTEILKSKFSLEKTIEDKQEKIDKISQENKRLQDELHEAKSIFIQAGQEKGSLYALQMENMQEKLFAKSERVSQLELELSKSKRKIESLESKVQEMKIEIEAKKTLNSTIE
ncbi:unnamed protein product [Blepharisma stoltei]|uniref:Uncharacterized protein n=1 Tax=Blepharisma stoltei TaxID=1481888 RepID=A0AAU9K716_9CILI|nr:unnamed protein product [Blepharisma stoltei]